MATKIVRWDMPPARFGVDREPVQRLASLDFARYQSELDAASEHYGLWLKELLLGMPSTAQVFPSHQMVPTFTEEPADCVDGRAWIDLQSRHESALTELHTLRRENGELERENSRLRRRVEAFERKGKR